MKFHGSICNISPFKHNSKLNNKNKLYFIISSDLNEQYDYQVKIKIIKTIVY